VFEVREEFFILGQQVAMPTFNFFHKHKRDFQVEFAQDVRHPVVVFEVMFQLLNPFIKLPRVNYSLVALIVLLDELYF